MSYWDLFAETGDIGFYLLHLRSTGNDASPEKNEATETEIDHYQMI